MNIEVEVEGDGAFAELFSLRQWLLDEPVFRGRVGLLANAPKRGTMGLVPEALAVALGGGTMAGAAVGVRNLLQVVSLWMKSRTGSVDVRIKTQGGAVVTVKATNVRRLNGAHLQRVLDDLARTLDPQAERNEASGKVEGDDRNNPAA